MSELNYVYKFMNNQNDVIYVGRTNNLNLRINQHYSKDGHLPKECIEEVDKIYFSELETLNESRLYELYYIAKHKPKFNTVFTRGGDITFNLQELPFSEYRGSGTIQKRKTEKEIDEKVRRVGGELIHIKFLLRGLLLKGDFIEEDERMALKRALTKTAYERLLFDLDDERRYKSIMKSVEEAVENVNFILGTKE